MLTFEIILFSLPFYIIFLFIQFKKRSPLKIIILKTLFFFYILGVISVTFFPIPIQGVQDFIDAGVEPGNNLIPFYSILDILSDGRSYVITRQIGGNFILLLPLGIFVPLIWEKRRTFWKAFQVGFLVTLGIEITQFLISSIIGYTYKIFDVDDIILNSAGFALGYLIFKFFSIVEQRWSLNR